MDLHVAGVDVVADKGHVRRRDGPVARSRGSPFDRSCGKVDPDHPVAALESPKEGIREIYMMDNER
jgi:hypothetical protein